MSLGVRTVRAEREMIADLDPRIERLAAIGDADPSYKMLIHHVENRTDINLLEENSELRKIGVASKELAIFTRALNEPYFCKRTNFECCAMKRTNVRTFDTFWKCHHFQF